MGGATLFIEARGRPNVLNIKAHFSQGRLPLDGLVPSGESRQSARELERVQRISGIEMAKVSMEAGFSYSNFIPISMLFERGRTLVKIRKERAGRELGVTQSLSLRTLAEPPSDMQE